MDRLLISNFSINSSLIGYIPPVRTYASPIYSICFFGLSLLSLILFLYLRRKHE